MVDCSILDRKIDIVVHYGSKPVEFGKGKNATELASEAEVADALFNIREATELGELDSPIEQQERSGNREKPHILRFSSDIDHKQVG